MDSGFRCEEHVGEVFPPRCSSCGTTTGQDAVAIVAVDWPVPLEVPNEWFEGAS